MLFSYTHGFHTRAALRLSHRCSVATPHRSKIGRIQQKKYYDVASNDERITLFSTTPADDTNEMGQFLPKSNGQLLTNNNITSTNNNNQNYPETPSYRQCLAFALPALGIYICSPLMSLIDAAFIGRASSVELAALGPASSISDSASSPLLFLSIAATNLIAKAYAQKDQTSLSRVGRTALGMGTIGGSVFAVLLYLFASPISVLYCGNAQSLVPACTQYVAIRALALPAVVITTIAQAICIGTKDTKTPMLSVALAGVLNLMGDFVLVKWLGQGISGAAWATSASQVLAAGLLLRVLKKRGFLEKEEDTAISTNNASMTTMATVKQILSFVPFLFVMTVKIGWHNSCSATAASLGGIQAAAQTALISVAMVCMVLGDVGSTLSQAFLPPFVSSSVNKDNGKQVFDMKAALPTIRQLFKCTLTISSIAMCLAASIIGIFGGQITSDPYVLAEMKRILPWIVATLSLHGSAVTMEGLLLSRKKFRGLTVTYSFLAITVAAFQFAIRRFHLGLSGVWGCYLWFCLARVVTFSALGGLFRPQDLFQKLRRKRRSVATSGVTVY